MYLLHMDGVQEPTILGEINICQMHSTMTKIITNQTNQTKNRIKFYSYEVKTHKIGQGLQITEEKEYKLCQVKGSQIRTERLITGTGQVVTKWSKTGAKITQWENKLQIAAKVTNRCITSMFRKTRSLLLCKRKF